MILVEAYAVTWAILTIPRRSTVRLFIAGETFAIVSRRHNYTSRWNTYRTVREITS